MNKIHQVKIADKFNLKLMVILLSLSSQLAFASMGETPISAGLHYITDAMYGATGIMIATISVMVVGLLCLGHFLKWTTLGFTIIGICIIFGAGAIVNGISSFIPRF